MDEVPGLMLLSSNYEFSNIVDNTEELEVTTVSNVQLAEQIRLQELGWLPKAANVYVYKKPSTLNVVLDKVLEPPAPVLKPVLPALEDDEDKPAVETEVPPSVGGLMEDV